MKIGKVFAYLGQTAQDCTAKILSTLLLPGIHELELCHMLLGTAEMYGGRKFR